MVLIFYVSMTGSFPKQLNLGSLIALWKQHLLTSLLAGRHDRGNEISVFSNYNSHKPAYNPSGGLVGRYLLTFFIKFTECGYNQTVEGGPFKTLNS